MSGPRFLLTRKANRVRFHIMFSNIDNLRSKQLLYVTSKGIAATQDGGDVGAGDDTRLKEAADAVSSDDEGEAEDG